jgi:hypothetical protein
VKENEMKLCPLPNNSFALACTELSDKQLMKGAYMKELTVPPQTGYK